MLDVAEDLSTFTLSAGEPFRLECVLIGGDGQREPLTGRAFVLSFHDDERQAVATIAATIHAETGGGVLRFARDGSLSESLFGRPLTVELAERLRDGREVIATGRLSVTLSAAGVAPLVDAATAGWVTRLTIRTGATGIRTIARAVQPGSGDASPPTPAPTPTPPPSAVTLAALGLSHATLTVGRAATIAVTGATAGSTIAATLPAGFALDTGGRGISGTPAAAGDLPVILVEMLTGATNSPRRTELILPVAAQPTVTLSGAVSQAEGDGGTTLFTYTVSRSPATGALTVPWTFAAGQTRPDDFAGGAYPAGGGVAMADGVASGSFTVTVAGDATFEPDESFSVAIVPPAGHVAAGATSAAGMILNDDADTVAGFAANGATNAAFRSAVARVRAGTGRGRIVWKGDSVTVGHGAGTTADGFRLTGARANRIPAVVARLMSAAGTAALDGSMVCDNGIQAATGQSLVTAYDPRIALVGTGGSAWAVLGAADLAGGGFWQPGTDRLTFTPTTPVDRFEIVAYVSNDETYGLTIDGAAPAAGPAGFTTTAGSGFVRQIVSAASAGTHTLAITGTTRRGALRSITGYAAGTAAIDMIVHAALGVQARQQAASGSDWSNREALIFDAPDLTIVMLGLNDMAAGAGAATYATHLATIVAAGRRSGDVLLVFPPPAGGNYNRDVTAYRDAAAAVARDAGVAFLSLYDHYGPFGPAIAARMADAEVHPDTAFAAEIAGVIHRALRLMAPAIG